MMNVLEDNNDDLPLLNDIELELDSNESQSERNNIKTIEIMSSTEKETESEKDTETDSETEKEKGMEMEKDESLLDTNKLKKMSLVDLRSLFILRGLGNKDSVHKMKKQNLIDALKHL